MDRALLQAEHNRIFQLLGELQEKVRSGEKLDRDARWACSHDLITYCSEHFMNEERAMKEAGYPGLSKHEIEHDRLHTRILEEGIIRCFMDGDPQEILKNLKDILVRHIVTWDMDFESWIERRQTDRLSGRITLWEH